MSAKAAELNELGNAAFREGRYEDALACYTQAVGCDSLTAKYHTNRANTLVKLNKFKKALQAANSSITADTTWVKGYYYKAVALEKQGQLQQAAAACDAGLQVAGSNQALKDVKSRVQQAMQDRHAQQEQQERPRMRQQQQQQQHQQEHMMFSTPFPLPGMARAEDLIPPAEMQQLRDIFVNAGELRGRDGSPHPFGWTGGLQPLQKRADWLIDCYRLRAADDAAAGDLHGLYAPNYTADTLCEDFLIFCTLSEQVGVAPASWKHHTHDAWPGWGYLVPLAASRLLQPFTQADAARKWGKQDAMKASKVPAWLRSIAAATAAPSGGFGRSLRYTAQLVYGDRVAGPPKEAASPPAAVRAGIEGKWGQIFGDMRRKDQATIHVGSFRLWEDMHRVVQQALQEAKE